jgi:hypothetical protein
MPYANGVTNAEYQRKYRERNREKLRQNAANNYHKNRDSIREKTKSYRLAHPGQDRKYYISSRKRSPWRFLVLSAKKRAEKIGVPFDLTNEWAQARWTGRCELTNLPFNLEFTGRNGPMHWSPSIDRKIPAVGYVQENCRFVLHCVNSFKSTGTQEEMLYVANALVKNCRP